MPGRNFRILVDHQANETDRLIAAELAADLTVINDHLADALMAIMRRPDEPEQLRAAAALALGQVLEQADVDGFEDPHDVMPLRSTRSVTSRNLSTSFISTTAFPRKSGGES